MKKTKELREFFKEIPAFTINDIVRKLSISRNYAWLMVHNLVRKGELIRIKKGFFTFYKDIEVVGFAFSPFYYGLQEALSLLGIWGQQTNPVVITPKKVRSGIRKFLGRNYIVKRIPRRLFFGFELRKYYKFWIPVSVPEKVLLDFYYFKEPLDGEIEKKLLEISSKTKLLKFAKRFPKRVLKNIKLKI